MITTPFLYRNIVDSTKFNLCVWVGWDRVQLVTPIVPAQDDYDIDECVTVGGIDTENRRPPRKLVPAPLSPPSVTHDLTSSAIVRSRRRPHGQAT
jgi:hypothetical protein